MQYVLDHTFRFAPRKALRSDDAPSPATASVPKIKQRVIATQDGGLEDAMSLLAHPRLYRLTARQAKLKQKTIRTRVGGGTRFPHTSSQQSAVSSVM